LKIAPGFSRGKLVFSTSELSRGEYHFQGVHPLKIQVSPL